MERKKAFHVAFGDPIEVGEREVLHKVAQTLDLEEFRDAEREKGREIRETARKSTGLFHNLMRLYVGMLTYTYRELCYTSSKEDIL